ncbi:hypothetical protein [Deinococcus ruber]|uniref:hypothetical protein n=1 Tax=Deinococcus ruber TaxID=1848197 RepID=UPI00166A25DB|nr:hypothetical protein [Deinococcus ruber]
MLLFLIAGGLSVSASCSSTTIPTSYVVTEVRAGCVGQGGTEFRFASLSKGLEVCDVSNDLAARLLPNWIIVARDPSAKKCRTNSYAFPGWIVTKADLQKGPFWVCPNSPVPKGFVVSSQQKFGKCGMDFAVLLIRTSRPAVIPVTGTLVPMKVNPDGSWMSDSGTVIAPPPF